MFIYKNIYSNITIVLVFVILKLYILIFNMPRF